MDESINPFTNTFLLAWYAFAFFDSIKKAGTLKPAVFTKKQPRTRTHTHTIYLNADGHEMWKAMESTHCK